MTAEVWPPPVRQAEAPSGLQPFEPTLRKRTYHALRQHMQMTREPLKDIAEHAGVGFHWLKTFATDAPHSPTVDNIERLYYYVTGRTL